MLVISTIFFVWQVTLSLIKLHDPPVIDTTETISIEDINLPVITVCPHKEFSWNLTALEKYGCMENPFYFLSGGGEKDYLLGWGAQWYMSFKEYLEVCTNPTYRYDVSPPKLKMFDDTYAWDNRFGGFTVEGVFVPAHPGYCFNIENYGVNQSTLQIIIVLESYEMLCNIFDIYLTDKSHWVMTSPYQPSHWGSKVSFNNDYLIEVEQVSNFDPANPESCKDYSDNEYQNCINDMIPFLDCNPPWYSTQNQCNSVYDRDHKFTMRKFIEKKVCGHNIWNKCPKPCTVIQSKIQTKAINTFSADLCAITLTFNEKVLKRTKSFSYGLSEFGVDMGSHLSLWFGLSFWSIMALIMRFYQWAKRWTKKVKEDGLYTSLLDFWHGNE